MIFSLLIIALIIVAYIILIEKSCTKIKNIEKKIYSLRLNYKSMLKSRRVVVDLCDERDKLGGNRKNIYSIGNNCEPWISRECIFILDHILSNNDNGLEWSSGSSTIWLGYRLKSLISIENSYKWATTVRNISKRLNLYNKISIHYIGEDEMNFCKNNTKYISSNGLCYRKYVTSNLIENKKYDYISVDGRARNGCILRAIELLKSNNGILVLDNSERRRYKWSINKIPLKWSRFDFPYSNGVVTVWVSHS